MSEILSVAEFVVGASPASSNSCIGRATEKVRRRPNLPLDFDDPIVDGNGRKLAETIGDVMTELVDGILSITFSERVHKFIERKMIRTIVVKLLGRQIASNALGFQKTANWWSMIFGKYLTVCPWSPKFSTTHIEVDTQTLVAFFINCCMHKEPPMLGVFQKFYQLKDKYVRVICKLENGFGFPTYWSLPQESVCAQCQPVDYQELSPNGCRVNDPISWLDDYNVPSASVAWFHNVNRSPSNSAQNMDIMAILDEARAKERDVATPPMKTSSKRNQKRPRVEESTQETEESEHPQLTQLESTHFVDSPIHTTDPPTAEIPTISPERPLVPSNSQPPNAFSKSLRSYLSSNPKLSPLSFLVKSSQALLVEYGILSLLIQETSNQHIAKIMSMEESVKAGEQTVVELR
ncbi:hypothetical protein Gotri_002464 [Gossypium trilobum]|uniref:DUF4283 domain-containing protein n=1 Tax=Gossypium trilobum TaxID=34281 RepID=A0A7J9F8D8_9ROSI|nr:hypothetical protein [Gossypium trilobum]